jgi:hypothetical protein
MSNYDFTVGFEKEFAVTIDELPVVISPKMVLPQDSCGLLACGLLAEARSQAFACPIEAAYSLKAAEHRLHEMAKIEKVELREWPIFKVPNEVRMAAMRWHTKSRVKHRNIYGYDTHRNHKNEMTAGLHVSICNTIYTRHKDVEFQYNAVFDSFRFVSIMDARFQKIISETKRRMGFYEIKPQGRIEYRSLPNTVDVLEVAQFLKEEVIPALKENAAN